MVETFLLTFSSLIVIFFIRNELVLQIRLKAIDIIFARPNWQEHRALLEKPSYNDMVFDLRCWTFAAFYPGLQCDGDSRA